MSKCDLEIRLEREDRRFRPGDEVRGEVVVRVNAAVQCRKLTIERRWRTHGRGNRDRGRSTRDVLFQGEWIAGEEGRYPFSFTLPNGPATYHGKYLNVDWYVQARADIPWAIDPKAETELLLEPGDPSDYDFGPRFDPERKMKMRSGKVVLTIIALACLGVGGAALIVYKLALDGTLEAEGEPLVMAIVGGLFAGIGAVLLLAAAWRSISQRKLGVPELRVEPRDLPRRGVVSAVVRLAPRAELEIEEATVELKASEVVTSGSGTNRTTHTHVAYTHKEPLAEPGQRLLAGEPVEWTAEAIVPPDGGLSFAASDNELRWSLVVHIGLAGWPDWKQEYPIIVRP